MAVKFLSFSSGSCGNCYFISLEENDRPQAGIIIDAGVSLRRLKRELASNGYGMDAFSSILVTHDHMDHIRNLGSYCKHLCKPVYATSTLHSALAMHSFTAEHIGPCSKELEDEGWTQIVPGRISARYFVVPHDATQTVGYALLVGGYRFVIMTDIGRMTDEALDFARQADTVVVESNYDMDMLIGGSYPHDLKMRICNGNGHLSNDECADAIRSFWHPELKHIYLCHLSENNNTPTIAYETAAKALGDLGFRASYHNSASFSREDGASLTMQPLPRRTPSPLFVLKDD